MTASPNFSAPAKKSLGQHFLHERHYIDNIVRAVDPRPGDTLVEIGPGQGAITFPLLRRHGALTAIEFDRDLIAPLTEAARDIGELTILHRDVLSVDFTALAAGGKLRLVGNLPYNLSSPILFHALDHAAAITDMHFMLQKEVVDRMAAGPGSKVYGRLSGMLQAYCEVTPLFVVPPGAFRPPPKVDSAVIRLTPRSQLAIEDPAAFLAFASACFRQKRKTLRNNLAAAYPAELYESRPEIARRAEQLSVEEFVELYRAINPG